MQSWIYLTTVLCMGECQKYARMRLSEQTVPCLPVSVVEPDLIGDEYTEDVPDYCEYGWDVLGFARAAHILLKREQQYHKR